MAFKIGMTPKLSSMDSHTLVLIKCFDNKRTICITPGKIIMWQDVVNRLLSVIQYYKTLKASRITPIKNNV